MSIIRLQNLLQSGADNGLEKLVQRARDMDRLAGTLKSGIGPELGPHLVAANLRADGMLVAVVDSPAWAARFRYETETLMRIAGNDGSNVVACRIVVAKDQGRNVRPENS